MANSTSKRFVFILLSLKALLGENRQRYMERLKERLKRRQKRLEEGLDPDEEDEETLRLLQEEEAASTGNILRDLQNRFDEEKDALLRRLQVGSAFLLRVVAQPYVFTIYHKIPVISPRQLGRVRCIVGWLYQGILYIGRSFISGGSLHREVLYVRRFVISGDLLYGGFVMPEGSLYQEGSLYRCM